MITSSVGRPAGGFGKCIERGPVMDSVRFNGVNDRLKCVLVSTRVGIVSRLAFTDRLILAVLLVTNLWANSRVSQY
jgi:hypothetical protein